MSTTTRAWEVKVHNDGAFALAILVVVGLGYFVAWLGGRLK